jgi:acyl-CoA synthetase (AMP-forming)/AMP-acid ligase II/aryl carrier-like protein
LSKTFKPLRHEPAGKKAASPTFLCLQDLLACYGRTAPGRNAILAPGQAPVTYGALWARANDTVRGLRSLGVRRSDRVAVVLPNGPEAAVALIAVAAGAICVPLNPGFTAEEWRRYFGVLRVSALLTRTDIDSASREVAHTLGIPIVDLSLQSSEGAFGLHGSTKRAIADDELASSTDDAFVLLTSGTSSRPKTVPLTHAAVCRSAYNVSATLALAPQDRLLNVLPLFHVHGLVSGLVAALAAGSSVVCTPRFDAAAFFRWLKEFRPTWYTAVPAIHRAVLSAAGGAKADAEPSTLRVIRSASSTLATDVTRELEALFGVPVIDTYGMTEAASQIAANPMGRRKPGSVGQSAGAEIAIMDREGRRLPAGKRGEIALRGPTITRGYDNDAVATEAAFRDGWFRTGDLGYLDRNGYLFIVGRIKDIINRGGQKVTPAEVEQALLAHPEVVDAAAFSVPHRRLGEDVAAAVVLRQGAEASALSLRAFARERLARYKVPGLIHLVPDIPKGPAGKIKRDELVAALSITLPTAEGKRGKLTPPRSKFESQLAMVWAELLELNELGVDEDVFALGADSITVTQVLSRLRALFGIDLSFKDLFDAPTVTLLAARLEALESVSRSLSHQPAYAGFDCAGAHLTDREEAPWTAPVQLAVCLSAARAAQHSRPRAQLCGNRAPARVPAYGIHLAGRASCRSHYPSGRHQIIPHRGKSSGSGACRKFTPKDNSGQNGGTGNRTGMLEAHRCDASSFIPGPSLPTWRHRSRVASDPARYHHRRLVHGRLHGRAIRTICRFYS